MYENNGFGGYENTTAQNSGNMNGAAGGNTYHYQADGSAFQNNHQPGGGGNKPVRHSKNGMGAGKKIAVGVCCGLAFGIFAGLGFQAVNAASDVLKASMDMVTSDDEGKADQAQIAETAVVSDTAEQSEAQTVQTTVTDVTQVVKEVMPSVVSVNNKFVTTMSYFGQQYSSESASTGSGIIVGQNDTELLLVSNYHVVESAEELSVQFVDGSQVAAQIKGTDENKDLAVLAVQLADIDSDTMNAIAIANLGNSDELTVGEPVIAIGNALGYGQSVTTGVVSALNRPIAISSTNQSADTETNTFIQTDAAINPGNSGGALLNIHGEVIGINSNKIGGTAIDGIGYAIPISDAKPIIDELMTKETKIKVEDEDKGYLGITGLDVIAEYVQMYGLPEGIYVSSVTEGSGADQAGLVKGDIITAINGETVTSMAELREELGYHAAGTTIEVTIMQGSPTGYQAKTVEVTLGKQESVQ